MIATGNDILNYIPQRAPIVMVSGLIHADEKSAETTFTIAEENIFVSNGKFTEPGIVEHIAQSTALHAGYGFVKAGKPIPIGYIAAVKDLNIHSLPDVNNELNTRLEIVNTIMNIILVKAEVTCNQTKIASCEMRVFIKE